MPRRSVLLTSSPVDAVVVARAARRVWETLGAQNPQMGQFQLLSLDEGAALQVRSESGQVMVTVFRPKLLLDSAETSRLLVGIDPQQIPSGTCWTEALTPWTEAGLIGVAVVQSAVDELGGQAVHSRDRAVQGDG